MGKGAEGPETLYTKDFLFLSTSTGLFFGGLQLLIPAIPLYVERMGGSRFEVGLAVGTLVVSALLFRPAVGSQIDRRGGKRFLALGCLVAVFASLGYIPASSLLPLLFFRILHGLGVASFTTAAATLVANLSPEKRRGEALGAFGISYVAAIAIAPALGAWALDLLPFSFLFLASSALALLALLISRPIEEPSFGSRPPRGGFLQAVSSRSVLLPSFILFAATSTYGTIVAFLPLLAQERDIPRYGLFFTFYGLSSLILRVPAGRLSDRLGRGKILVPALLCLTFSVLLIALARSSLLLLLAGLLYGGSLGSAYPALIAWVVEANPPERRGAVLSIFTAFFELGLAFGSIILGLVGEAFGLQTMFLLSGLLALGGLILFWQSHGGRPS